MDQRARPGTAIKADNHLAGGIGDANRDQGFLPLALAGKEAVECRDIEIALAQVFGVMVDGIAQQEIDLLQRIGHVPLDEERQVLGFQQGALPLLFLRIFQQVEAEGDSQQDEQQPAQNEAPGQNGRGKRGELAGRVHGVRATPGCI